MIDPALLLLNLLVSVAFWFGRWVELRVLRGRAVALWRRRDQRLVSGLALHTARSVRDLSSRRARPCPPKVPPMAPTCTEPPRSTHRPGALMHSRASHGD